MREILKDALYGSLTGALIGGAVMAFKDKPADHAGLVAIGGAVGALGGAAYGAYSVNRANRALAKVESGKVTLQMPTVMPELKDSPSRGQMAIIIQAEVLRGTF